MRTYADKHDTETGKMVTFYIIYTCIYFPLMILTLFWTGGIYYAGKFNFQPVLTIIVVAEMTKYFAGAIHFNLKEINLSKKHEDKSLASVFKQLFSKSKLKEGFKSLFTVSLMTLVFFVITILFGAEVFSKYEETFMFSALLSVLTILPACINLGAQSIYTIIFESKPNDGMGSLIFFNMQMTIFGAWLGAFVIPLDWDRPWQEWPIPCSTGAMMGFAASYFIKLFEMVYSVKKPTKSK